MMETVSLQVIIDTIAYMLTISVPIGILFGMASKLTNMFFSMAFGEKKVRF